MSRGRYTWLSEKEWDRLCDTVDAYAASCRLCPRACGVNRFAGARGFCNAPGGLVVSSIFPHHGEEPPISGTQGSGTVFFSFCTLRCIFCQNWQISHQGLGDSMEPEKLAEELLLLQEAGCHNINLVTPTHQLPWILRALRRSAAAGLTLPVVYNCGGYETVEVVTLLSQIVDIWLPDMKYESSRKADTYSRGPDYPAINRAAIRTMFKTAGPLLCDREGSARRGLLIRHLVLPNDASGSFACIDWLAKRFDPEEITLCLMAQYQPLHRATAVPSLDRPVTEEEYRDVCAYAIDRGFTGYFQEHADPDDRFRIDFSIRKRERLE